MSSKMRMYNVQFGDSFLIFHDKENLLVDLGSVDKNLNFDVIRHSLLGECNNTKLSLLLTHFHKDHWSGLQKNASTYPIPKIEHIYLPDIFGMQISQQWDVIKKSLLSDFLESIILNKNPEYTLADLLYEAYMIAHILANIKLKIFMTSLGNNNVFALSTDTTPWPKI